VDETAYIAIDPDGALTLYWGDGTEPEKVPLARRPCGPGGLPSMNEIEALCRWAWEHGYQVITPTYDLEAPPLPLEPTQQDLSQLDLDEIDALLDDLQRHADRPDATGGT